MPMMCNKDSCKTKSGPCGHEKMMIAVIVIIAFFGVSHWALHLF